MEDRSYGLPFFSHLAEQVQLKKNRIADASLECRQFPGLLKQKKRSKRL